MEEPAWIKHDGSATCPVPAGHDVEVRYLDGMTWRGLDPEGNRYWVYVTHYRDWTAFEQQQASAGEVPIKLDFDDTSDVSDEAIQWVLKTFGYTSYTVSSVRKYSDYSVPRTILTTARLIQQHHPELLVDPDAFHVREAFAADYEKRQYTEAANAYRKGECDNETSFKIALALYKEGKEASKTGNTPD